MKIFLDDFCFNCINIVMPYGTAVLPADTYKKYQHIDQIPDACDLISTTFYNNNYSAHADVIQQLLVKTQRLLVVVDEPTGDFYQFVQAHSDPRIVIFSPVIANFSAANLRSLISWFGQSNNYYAEEAWAKKLRAQLNSDLDRPKRFDCLLGIAKPHRNRIEQLYKSSADQDSIVYSYFKDQVSQGIWSQKVDSAQTTTHRVRMDIHGNFVAISNLLPVDIYNQTFYSIVAETVCTNYYSQFTEKTAKPIVAGRPFIVFSGQYFLRNLRSMGFQTFDTVIDERYDDIEDETERLTQAWQEVERLCRLDPAIVMQKLQPVLAHNQQHFLSTDWMHPLAEYIQSIKTGATGVI